MVGLHATADPTGLPFADAAPSERVFPVLLRALLYIARTELFLMISVLLLLMALERRPRSYRETLQLQASRLLLPFLFWTVFYAFFGLIKAQAFGYLPTATEQLIDPNAWVRFLLLGDVKYHMHFIPTLFALLLFFPMFRVAQRQPVWGLLVIALLLVKRHLDAFFYPQFWEAEWLPYLLRLVKVVTYVGYGLAAGAALGLWQQVAEGERQKWVPIVVLIGALLFVFKLISSIDVIQTGAWNFEYEPGYWADFLMPVVLLVVCMCLAERHWPAWTSSAAKFAFGIYLCHPIFLDFVEVVLANAALSPSAQVLIELLWTLPATCMFVAFLSRHNSLAWTIGLGPAPRPGIGGLKSHLK